MVLRLLAWVPVWSYVEPDGSVTHYDIPDFVPPTDPADIPTTPHDPERVKLTLQMELRKYDKEWIELYGLRLGQYYQLQEFSCEQRLFYLADCAAVLAEKVNEWHLNFTGTAGLWWLHKSDVADHTWAWLIHYFFEKITISVRTYMHKASLMSFDRPECFSTTLRKWLTASVISYQKLMSQHTSLLWNGLAFGVLGDVTNDKAIDPVLDEEAALEGVRKEACVDADCKPELGSLANPQGNLIFAHMFTGSINEFVKKHTMSIHEAISSELNKGNMSENLRPHHQDEEGHFVYFEALRREVFKQWAVDKGLLRGLLKLIRLDGTASVGDFGAGGGYYSKWLNDTGLLSSFAFDGTPDIDHISPGVMFLNLNEPDLKLWRTFDWVICLEVAEHIPAKYTDTLLRNVGKHAQDGIIMSWSADMEGIGHVNCMKELDFHDLVEKTIPFRVDHEATAKLRSMCTVDYIQRSVTVFRRVSSMFDWR